MAAFVGLWAGMNYEQLTSLFRVEERSVAFVSASLTNILVTVGATLLLVVALDKGPIGVIVGNFTGTLLVYAILIGYRREQLGLQFDRQLLREMNRFGVPLVPTALFLWVTNFSRPPLPRAPRRHDRGRPLLGRRAHRVGARAPADGVPARVAGVRVLDRRRRRGAQDVRVRPDLPRASSRPGSRRASRCSPPGSCGGSRRPPSRSRRASSARSPSRRSRSPATSSSRSGSAAPGGRSSTGSSPEPRRSSTSRSTCS